MQFRIMNGHEETIYPGKGIAFSYEDLGHFTEAKELRMWGCELTDYSFIANMIHLKALSLGAGATVEIDSFSHKSPKISP